MIKSLSISNFIIVESIHLDFSPGLQVLTGETGAGKSIIMGALNILLGAPLKSGMLFNKSLNAKVEAVFSVDPQNINLLELLDKYEVEAEDEEFFITKEITIEEKALTFLNGRRVTNSIIKEFREVLFDFHGQRDQQNLFDKDIQLSFLDKYGKLDSIREEFSEQYKATEASLKELDKLIAQDSEQQDKLQLYEFQLKEIEDCRFNPEVDENLQQEYNFLNHAKDILALTQSMQNEMYEQEKSVYDVINSYLYQFGSYEKDSEIIKQGLKSLNDSLLNLDDALKSFSSLESHLNIDEERLIDIETRINTLNNMKLKYKLDLVGIISYGNKIRDFIENSTSNKERINELKKQIESTFSVLRRKGKELSKLRQSSASAFSAEISSNLKLLAIQDCSFKIIFDKINHLKQSHPEMNEFNETGIDSIEFLFSANKGSDLQTLKNSISGGELSRLLLVIKKLLADNLEARTIVFDEIDSGIGGKTADMLGSFIAKISENHQVLCITHLPQIAAYGVKHFNINKLLKDNRTTILVEELSVERRKREIARMLSGSDSELALLHAEEILRKGD